MRAALLFVPLCTLTGSLALPQTIAGSSVSLPGVQLSPADQTACIQSCSTSVAQAVPDALNACLDATGDSAPKCLCTDDTLIGEMQSCFGVRCPPLQGRCAAILGGSSFLSGSAINGGNSQGSPGSPGQSGGSSPNVSFPDVDLPPAQQTACVQSCSADVADRNGDALDACLDAPDATPVKCLCTDATLVAEMQSCYGSRCAPLQGRCAAIVGSATFVAGTVGTSSPGSSGSGTSSSGTSTPGTSSPGTPGSTGAGTSGSTGGSTGGAAGAPGSGSSGPSGSSSGTSPGPAAPAAGNNVGGQPSAGGAPSGTGPTAAGASPAAPPAPEGDNAANPDPDNGAGSTGAVPLALAVGLAFAFLL